MSWLGLLLVGLAVTDLVHSVRPVRRLPEAVAAVVTLALGLLAGLSSGRDLVAVLVVAAVVVAWGQAVTWGFGRRRAWVPLAVLGVSVLVAIAFSGQAGPVDGPLRSWVEGSGLPLLADLDADRFLLLLGVVLVQLSTGNVIVRLVLESTGTLLPPEERDPDGDPRVELKGGRLLGPMERLLILGLGLAGQLTAASLVVAAKGLLRFPELSSRREQERIHRLTEYFLVGSFVSWLVALTGVALLA